MSWTRFSSGWAKAEPAPIDIDKAQPSNEAARTGRACIMVSKSLAVDVIGCANRPHLRWCLSARSQLEIAAAHLGTTRARRR